MQKIDKKKFKPLVHFYYKFHYEIIALFIFMLVLIFGVLLDGINTSPYDYITGELHSYIFAYIVIIGFAVTMPFLPTLIGASLSIAIVEFIYQDANYYIMASFIICVAIILTIHFLKLVIHQDYILIIIANLIFMIGYFLAWGFINNFASAQISQVSFSIFLQTIIILTATLLIDQTLKFIAKKV